jgi:hypothetical protein
VDEEKAQFSAIKKPDCVVIEANSRVTEVPPKVTVSL